MKLSQIFTWVPIGLAVIGSLYTGVTVVSKLNQTIENHTLAISDIKTTINMGVFKDIGNLDSKFTESNKTLTIMYQEAREEMVRETVNIITRIASLEAELRALNDSYYKLSDSVASEAEVRALQDSYYKLSDSINQLGYDIKDLKNGGYN